MKKKSIKAAIKLMLNSYIGVDQSYKKIQILHMNLGNIFVNLDKKSLIGIQLSYKEVIGIIFIETDL